MAEMQTLARPYARAVFELGRDQATLARWSTELSAIAAVVADPGVAAVIGHPALSRAALADLMASALGSTLSAEALSFLAVLIDNRRLMLAPFVAERFEVLRHDHERTVDVDITTATEVVDAQRTELTNAIARKLDRKVTVSWATDESLIAGAVIRAGDTVIDGSVKGELEKLKAALAS